MSPDAAGIADGGTGPHKPLPQRKIPNTYAGFGAGEGTAFEIGSIAKAMTGMVLADQAARGGPPGPAGRGTGPRHAAGRRPRDAGGEPSYSNLGGATLGNALARHGGTTCAELLERTLLRPVGMRRTTVVTREAELPADRARGKDARNGRHQDPWIAAGCAPAGSGVWSTAEDLAVGFGLGFTVAFAVSMARAGRRDAVDRRSLIDGGCVALVGVFVSWLWVPWDVVPPLAWALPVALTAYGVLRAADLWPRLPWVTGPRPALKAGGTVANVAVVAVIYAVALA